MEAFASTRTRSNLTNGSTGEICRPTSGGGRSGTVFGFARLLGRICFRAILPFFFLGFFSTSGHFLESKVFESLSERLGVDDGDRTLVVDKLVQIYGLEKNDANRSLFLGLISCEIERQNSLGLRDAESVADSVISVFDKNASKIVSLGENKRNLVKPVVICLVVVTGACIVWKIATGRAFEKAKKKRRREVASLKGNCEECVSLIVDKADELIGDLTERNERMEADCDRMRLENSERRVRSVRVTEERERELRGVQVYA